MNNTINNDTALYNQDDSSSTASIESSTSEDNYVTSAEKYLFRLLEQLIESNAIDKSKLSPSVLKKIEQIETICGHKDSQPYQRISIHPEDGDMTPQFEDNDLAAILIAEKEIQDSMNTSNYLPINEEISDVSISDVDSETTTLSNSVFSTSNNSVLELSDEEKNLDNLSDSSESQLSSSQLSLSSTHLSSDVTNNFDINSNTVKQFMNKLGNENVTQSVFDPNNRGVDFFLLPIFYTPQLCGSAPESALKAQKNEYIADRYLIVRKLGKATFSVTVECIDMRGNANEHLCLKIIQNGEFFLEQSLDEIRVLRYLNKLKGFEDAHLLKLYDFFFNKRHLMIVTELLHENLCELTECFNKNPSLYPYFTLPRIRIIVKQILEGLQFIHSHNIMHCDLKPENILIQDRVNALIKIVDFGGSNFTSSLKSHINHNLYIQSRSYRAPEIILGIDFDERIDLWSLGCITAELFTQRLLLDNSSIGALLTSASSLLEPVPEYILKMAGLKVHQTNDNFLVYLRNGEIWYIDPIHQSLEETLGTSDPDFIDFIRNLLRWDPNQRLTASQALQHPFIQKYRPCDPYVYDIDK